MFIDYLTLLLINMTAGFALLAAFFVWGWRTPAERGWGPGFVIVGALALIFGGHITLTWPLPGPFNMAFGEMSVLFGAIFLMAGIALLAGWSLYSVAAYAFFAGLAALVVGVRINNLGLTANTEVSTAGFIFSGLTGVGALPALWLLKDRPFIARVLAAGVPAAAAAIWALTGYLSYWAHFSSQSKWVPLIMRGMGAE